MAQEWFETKEKATKAFYHQNSDTKTRSGLSRLSIDPYFALKMVFITTFSILKPSESVNFTFIQRSSHYVATSFSLFSCHIWTKTDTEIHRSLAKLFLCPTSIQRFTIVNDLIMTSQREHIYFIEPWRRRAAFPCELPVSSQSGPEHHLRCQSPSRVIPLDFWPVPDFHGLQAGNFLLFIN